MSAIVRTKGVMPSLQCERSAILLCGLGLALANALYAQSVGKLGDEISISGPRRGDQTAPQVSIGPTGGYAVWQDSVSDGVSGSFGIVARKLNPDLTATSQASPERASRPRGTRARPLRRTHRRRVRNPGRRDPGAARQTIDPLRARGGTRYGARSSRPWDGRWSPRCR